MIFGELHHVEFTGSHLTCGAHILPIDRVMLQDGLHWICVCDYMAAGGLVSKVSTG